MMKDYENYTNKNFYFDVHGHFAGTLPWIWKAASLFRMPKDRKLTELVGKRVGGVVCAIGDVATFKRTKKSPMELTVIQLHRITNRLGSVGVTPVDNSSDFAAAIEKKTPAYVLGVEGGDFLEKDLTRLKRVYDMGVRLLGPMHYSVNYCGSIIMGWGGRDVPESERTGLTDFGRKVIAEANRLGIILDLAHADEETLMATAIASKTPVVCTHSAPYELQAFPRYITDEAIKLIADTGGFVGLWPFYAGKKTGKGMSGPEAFKEAAIYVRNLVGAEGLAIGTDFNGVPGYMNGYDGPLQGGKLVQYLDEAGFTDEEIIKVTGLNFLRVFKAVEESK